MTVTDKNNQDKEPVENEQPTARELFYGKVREHYPDDDINDDDIYGKADELLSNLNGFKTNRDNIDGKLKDIFDGDPKLGAVFSELIEGKKPFRAILAEHYTPEDLVPQDGDDDYEAYSKTLEGRKKAKAESQERDAKMQQNIENAEKVFKQFAQEKGLDDKGMEDFSMKIQTVLKDMGDGVLSPETLSLFHKGLNYDEDNQVAELRGRNANIKEKIVKQPKSDGLPDTTNASKEPVNKERPEQHKMIDDMMGGRKKVL